MNPASLFFFYLLSSLIAYCSIRPTKKALYYILKGGKKQSTLLQVKRATRQSCEHDGSTAPPPDGSATNSEPRLNQTQQRPALQKQVTSLLVLVRDHAETRDYEHRGSTRRGRQLSPCPMPVHPRPVGGHGDGRWRKRERQRASIGRWRRNDYGGRAAARQPDSPTPEPGDLPAFPLHPPRPCAATRAIHAQAPHLLLPRGPPSYYAARRLAQGPAR